MSDCQHQTRGLKESNVQNQRQQSAEERERLLDAIADQLANIKTESDIEELEHRLEQYDPEHTLEADFDVEQSLKEFHTKYEITGEKVAAAGPAEVPKKKRSRFFRHTARIAIIAAVLCSFVVAAQASGLDILRAIAQWTSEQFHLEWITADTPNTSQTDTAQYTSLQDALLYYGVDLPLVPTSLPQGSVLESVSTRYEEGRLLFYAIYRVPNGQMYIAIRHKTENNQETAPFSEIEKNEDNVSLYEAGGITHHIMSDVTMNKAVWQNGEWECSITGDITRDDLTAMIDSIYE